MKRLLAATLAPSFPLREKGRDLPLEGLRGLCALLVLYAHMTMPFLRLDPGFAPPRTFWWFNLGSVAVLFFFVLSGYVIGLSYGVPFSRPAAFSYAGRRFLRLTPINTAAVLLAWLFLPQVGTRTVLANLAFLQSFAAYPFGVHLDVMPDNLNLWSLNFEVVYYGAFLLVWALAPTVGLVLAGVAALAATGFLPGDHLLASSYAYGALYWLAGLGAAWLAPVETRRGNWPSAMLAIAVLYPLAPLQRLLSLANIPDTVGPLPLPCLHRLDLLPACLWLLLAVTGRAAACRRWLSRACLFLATVGAALILREGAPGDQGAFACHCALLALAWLLVRWEPEPAALAGLAPVGAISFGIYAVAFPIQYGVYRMALLPAGTPWTFALRALVLVSTSLGVAWFLERKLQPAIVRALRRPGTGTVGESAPPVLPAG